MSQEKETDSRKVILKHTERKFRSTVLVKLVGTVLVTRLCHVVFLASAGILISVWVGVGAVGCSVIL